MKKRVFIIITAVFLVSALISLFAAPILAGQMEVEFTASLSASDTDIVAGESVNFTVHVVNTR